MPSLMKVFINITMIITTINTINTELFLREGVKKIAVFFGRPFPNLFTRPPTPGFLWDLGKRKVKFGSKRGQFGGFLRGLDLVWESATAPTHIWERYPKKTVFFWQPPYKKKMFFLWLAQCTSGTTLNLLNRRRPCVQLCTGRMILGPSLVTPSARGFQLRYSLFKQWT